MSDIIGIIENILFAAGTSVPLKDIAQALDINIETLKPLIADEILRRENDTGLLIRQFGDSIQLCTRREHAPLLFSMFGEQTGEDLSRAMIETLAIVAYRQPVTRLDVEELRGVNSSYVLNSLLDKELIVEAGRKDTLGKPILYATSESFLRHFGISSLDELPTLPLPKQEQKELKESASGEAIS